MVDPEIPQPQRNKVTELQHSKEFLKEEDSTVVRQTLMITGDFNISWQIWHIHESLTIS